MINHLAIKSFKSIKDLSLSCKKINVFIGEPNVGKSNLLEALSLFSCPYLRQGGQIFPQLVRFENFTNLFCGDEIKNPIHILASEDECRHEFAISYQGNSYLGNYLRSSLMDKMISPSPTEIFSFRANSGGVTFWQASVPPEPLPIQSCFRVYKFGALKMFPAQDLDFLEPLDGPNLLFLLRTNGELYKLADELFRARGYRLVLRPHENKIEIQNGKDARLILFPYSTASDTLQRFIFHLAAIETNHNSVIVLEEPESHAFPYYTKILAESMALDESGNQFFITTHNPYFLFPLVCKAPRDQLAVFITTMEDYETRVRPLNEQEIAQAMDLDADLFYNFDRFTGGA